jgi:outer membrane protein OmpA-like peptidoglycan-associated protein
MPAPRGETGEFEKLKALLAGAETKRLDEVETLARKVDGFIGDKSRLESATGEILSAALRRAEVADHKELSGAIAPLVVAAIRSEIKNSKDMMVEALYPITGRLVTAAVAHAFRDLVETINQRIDALVSADMWRLRMRAMASGRSLAEVILAESDIASLKRALLLERGSGRALAHWPLEGDDRARDELTSGLIAAISEFATTVYADEGGELRMMDFGASHVFLRASARVIVAGEFAGDLSPKRERKLDDAFLKIVEAHDKEEDDFSDAELGKELDDALKPEPRKAASKAPAILIGLALLALAIYASIDPATRYLRERKINGAYAAAMASQPGLADFPLRLDIDHADGRVTLRGLSADDAGPRAVAEAIATAAKPYVVERDVKLVALSGEAEANAATKLAQLQQALVSARAEISRLNADKDSASARLQRLLETFAIFFTEQDSFVDTAAASAGLDELASLMKSTGQEMRVVGYADETGAPAANRSVARKRAEKIVALLVERGVPREKLAIAPRATLLPIADSGVGSARSRRVVFERVYDGEFQVR